MKTYKKYDLDGPFDDPIVRCCDCQMIILREQIQKHYGCPKCGNKRVRNVLNMTEDEMADLKKKGIDPVFLALFEGVPEDDDDTRVKFSAVD